MPAKKKTSNTKAPTKGPVNENPKVAADSKHSEPDTAKEVTEAQTEAQRATLATEGEKAGPSTRPVEGAKGLKYGDATPGVDAEHPDGLPQSAEVHENPAVDEAVEPLDARDEVLTPKQSEKAAKKDQARADKAPQSAEVHQTEDLTPVTKHLPKDGPVAPYVHEALRRVNDAYGAGPEFCIAIDPVRATVLPGTIAKDGVPRTYIKIPVPTKTQPMYSFKRVNQIIRDFLEK